jgi:hypothetical protein
VVLKDATLLRGVEGCQATPWCWMMPHCSVVLKDATLLLVHRNVKEICYSSKLETGVLECLLYFYL